MCVSLSFSLEPWLFLGLLLFGILVAEAYLMEMLL